MRLNYILLHPESSNYKSLIHATIHAITLCKPHISGILTHYVSDYFMSFYIVKSKVKRTKDTPKYIDIENITPLFILNFKTTIGNTDLLSQFDSNPQADPNFNYSGRKRNLDTSKTKEKNYG